MAIIRRGTIPLKFADALKLQQGDKGNPSDTSEKVVLTYDFNNANYCDVVKSVSSTSTAALNVLSIPSDRDFYLKYALLSGTKNATDDGTDFTLSVVSGGATFNVLRIASLTLTAISDTIAVSFDVPIKCDRGTSIACGHTTTAGAMEKCASIAGFYLEG